MKELKEIRKDFHEQQGVTTILSSIKELATIAGLDEPKEFSLDILRAQLRGVADVVNGKRPSPPDFATPPPKRVCVKPRIINFMKECSIFLFEIELRKMLKTKETKKKYRTKKLSKHRQKRRRKT